MLFPVTSYKVRALRGVNEANEVAVAMGSNKRFKVHLGGTVDHDHLFSLRQEDVLPLHKNRVTVQVHVSPHCFVFAFRRSLVSFSRMQIYLYSVS